MLKKTGTLAQEQMRTTTRKIFYAEEVSAMLTSMRRSMIYIAVLLFSFVNLAAIPPEDSRASFCLLSTGEIRVAESSWMRME